MATVPVLTFHDGKLDVPEQLQQDWKLREGSELRVVSLSSKIIQLEQAGEAKPDYNSASADWRSLQGILAGTGSDATTLKRDNKELELAHEERKFGISRPSW